jgi:carbamoyltransferase
MKILGLNYIFHDSSTCLIIDGELAFAVEEERLSRRKHTQSFPHLSIAQALEQTATRLDDIDHIAVSIAPGKSEDLKLSYAAALGDEKALFLEYEFERLRKRHLDFWEWYHAVWPGGKGPKVHFVDHHLAHAAGTYFVSPWDKAALLSIDGWGEWSTTWAGLAEGNKVERFTESFFPNSLGVFYSVATQFCGFLPNYDEGKTMGLAPCGNPDRHREVVDSMVRITDDLEVVIDPEWFDFPSLKKRLFGQKFIDHFGAPRRSGEPINDRFCDVAAAFQAVLEDRVLDMARGLAKRTGCDRLVHSGGVALNSVANGKILEAGIFKEIFMMPGAGDNGTSIGAAAYVHSAKLGETKRVLHASPYLGRQYSDADIEDVLAQAKIPFGRSSDIYADTADKLHDGLIVGWFQNRMEFGPRALGARSILADPTNADMKHKINAEVKHREPFRPFAPSVLRERSQEYFEINTDVPYMLKVAQVLPAMRNKIPAVVHVDGSARLQTVDRDMAPEYHQLITTLGERTGHPVVLNTSFNVMGEPIVESPLDAIRCFFSTGIDVLVMGDFVVEKDKTIQDLTQTIAAQ